jgi:hypothetical protein
MSRALSERQILILVILRGTESGRRLTTDELLERLRAHDMVNAQAPRRQQLNAVRKACESLERHGLVEWTHTYSKPRSAIRTKSWMATSRTGSL